MLVDHGKAYLRKMGNYGKVMRQVTWYDLGSKSITLAVVFRVGQRRAWMETGRPVKRLLG